MPLFFLSAFPHLPCSPSYRSYQRSNNGLHPKFQRTIHGALPKKKVARILFPRIAMSTSQEVDDPPETTTPASSTTTTTTATSSNIRLGPRGVFVLGVWLSFLIYAAFFSPGEAASPILFEIVKHPLKPHVNTIYFAIFNMLGALGAIYPALLASGEVYQPVPLLPFGVGSLFTGFFSIGPYLAVRKFRSKFDTNKKLTRLASITESKAFGTGLLAFALFCYAIALGVMDEPGTRDALFYERTIELRSLFKTDKLVNVSMIDFALLSVFMWGPLTEDMARRSLFSEKSPTDILTALIILTAPVLGPSLYLVLRPSLDRRSKDVQKRG